ncbi:MAG: tetratricopeptide repeat protein, partial [Deltaproteobacteria bacterium]|nr:tetratricopeptide repeat protein [Deltaproteobacteria bacterium]
HPPATLAHMAAFALFGKNPAAHHLLLVVLHILAAWMLFAALRKLTGSTGKSALAAALFAVHPVNVEAVAWIAQCKTVLAGLFFFAAVHLYARYAKSLSMGAYVLSLGAFLVSVSANPLAAAMPLAFVALDYWPLGRFAAGRGAPQRTVRALLAEKLPFLAVSAGVLLFALSRGPVFGLAPAGAEGPGLLLRLAYAASLPARYLATLAYPAGLSVFHPFPWQVGPATAAAGFLVFAAITVLAVWQAGRMPFVLAGWAWFLAGLVPVSGLFQLNAYPAMADRFLYIPAVGVFLAVIWLAAQIFSQGRRAAAGVALGMAVLVLMGGLAANRTATWSESEKLLSAAVSQNPENYTALWLLGDMSGKKGDIEAAEKYYQASITANPSCAPAYKGMGDILAAGEKYGDAIEWYEKAIKLEPGYWTALHNLAAALERRGRLADAAKVFEATASMAPHDAMTYVNLGILLTRLGRLEEAKEALTHAMDVRPDYARAYLELGNLNALMGNIPDAARCYGSALRLEPELEGLRESMARVLKGGVPGAGGAGKDMDPRVTKLLRAMEKNPDDPRLHNNLGTLFENQGLLGQAEFHYRRALVLDPDYALAASNLGMLLARQGNVSEALELLARAAEHAPESVAPAYNLACLYSLEKNREQAVYWLEEAVRRGLDDKGLVESDPDLEWLRKTPEAGRILEAMP